MTTVSSHVNNIRILNQLNKANTAAAKNVSHVTTGKKVNSAADNASAYAISEQMQNEIKALNQANANVQTGSAMLSVADGALSETVDILTTLREKALAAANSTATDEDRAAIQKTFDQYLAQITDNSNVDYNGMKILDGSYTSATKETNQAFTNGNLGVNTDANTKLVDLTDRDGNSLNIQATDTVSISYVKDGKTITSNYSAADTTVGDIFQNMNNAGGEEVFDVTNIGNTSYVGTGSSGEDVYTANGENAISVKAATGGTDGKIAGFTVGVFDSEGNKRNSANNALDSFSETIAATNEREDNSLKLQTGTNSNEVMSISIVGTSARALGLQGSDGKYISVGTQENAEAALNAIDNAINTVLDQQTTIGAYQSRLDYTSQNLIAQNENLTAADSTAIDADIAKEMTEYASNNVIKQAAQAMLAQSIQNSNWYLSLLG